MKCSIDPGGSVQQFRVAASLLVDQQGGQRRGRKKSGEQLDLTALERQARPKGEDDMKVQAGVAGRVLEWR